MAKKGRQGDGGGRPKFVFTEAQIKEIETLASVLTKGQLADYYGISEDTFRAAEARQPDVFLAYKKGRSRAIASVAGNLVTQARGGNTAAAIFYLKTQAGWKETSAIDHKSTDGSMTPKAALDVSKLSDDALKEIINASKPSD